MRYMRMSKLNFDISRFLRGIRELEPEVYRAVVEELRRRKVREVEKRLSI
jgi:predicted translin family RNA/ssDNA-binding protein